METQETACLCFLGLECQVQAATPSCFTWEINVGLHAYIATLELVLT